MKWLLWFSGFGICKGTRNFWTAANDLRQIPRDGGLRGDGLTPFPHGQVALQEFLWICEEAGEQWFQLRPVLELDDGAVFIEADGGQGRGDDHAPHTHRFPVADGLMAYEARRTDRDLAIGKDACVFPGRISFAEPFGELNDAIRELAGKIPFAVEFLDYTSCDLAKLAVRQVPPRKPEQRLELLVEVDAVAVEVSGKENRMFALPERYGFGGSGRF